MESINNFLQSESRQTMSETCCVDMNCKECNQVVPQHASQAHSPECEEKNSEAQLQKAELLLEEEEEENERKLLWMCNEVFCNEDMYDTLAHEAERLITHCGRLLKMPEETEKSLRNWIRSDANLFRSDNNNNKTSSNTSSYIEEDKSAIADAGTTQVITQENSYMSEDHTENIDNCKKEMVCIPSLNLVLAAIDRLNTHSIRTKRAMAVSASASLPLRGSIFTQHKSYNGDIKKTNVHENSLTTKAELSIFKLENNKELIKLHEVILCARLIAWYCLSTARFCGFAFNHMSREASGRPTPIITRHSRARLRREFPGHYSTIAATSSSSSFSLPSSHGASTSSSLKSSFAQAHINENATRKKKKKKKTAADDDKDGKDHDEEEEEQEEEFDNSNNLQEMDAWVGSRMSSAAASSLAQSILSPNLTDEQLAEQFYRPAINAIIKYSTFTFHQEDDDNNVATTEACKERIREEGNANDKAIGGTIERCTRHKDTYFEFINSTLRSSVLWLLTALFIRFPDTKFNTAAYLPMLFPTGTNIEFLTSSTNSSNHSVSSPMPHPLLAPLLHESSLVVRTSCALAILALLRKLHSVLLYAEEAKMHQRAFAAISTQCGEMLFTLHDALYKSLLRSESSSLFELSHNDERIINTTALIHDDDDDDDNNTNKSAHTKCIQNKTQQGNKSNHKKEITKENANKSHYEIEKLDSNEDNKEKEDEASFTEWLVEMNEKRKERQEQRNATSSLHWEKQEEQTNNASQNSNSNCKSIRCSESTHENKNNANDVHNGTESINNAIKSEVFKSLSRTRDGLILEVFAAVVRSTPYRRCTRCTHAILHTLQLPLLRRYLRHIELPEHLCVTRLLMQVFNNESLNQAVLTTLFASSDWTTNNSSSHNNIITYNYNNTNNFRVSYTQDAQWSFREARQPSSTSNITSCETSLPLPPPLPPPPYSPDSTTNFSTNVMNNNKEQTKYNTHHIPAANRQRTYSFLIDELLANAVYGSELWRCVVQLARLYPPVIHANFNVLITASEELFAVLHNYEELIASCENNANASNETVSNVNRSKYTKNTDTNKNNNSYANSSNNNNKDNKSKNNNSSEKNKGNKKKSKTMEQETSTSKGAKQNKQAKAQSVNNTTCGNAKNTATTKTHDKQLKIRRSRHSYNTCVIAFAECLRAWLHFMGYVWKGFDNNSLDPAFRPWREKQRASLEEKRIIYTHIIKPALSLEQPSEVIQIVLLRCLAQVGEEYIAELPNATLHDFVRYVRVSCVCSNAEIRAEALTTIGVWLWQYAILDDYAPEFIRCAMHIIEEDEDHVVRAKAAFALSNVCSRLPRSNVNHSQQQQEQYLLEESSSEYVTLYKNNNNIPGCYSSSSYSRKNDNDTSMNNTSNSTSSNSFYELIVKANLLHALAESALFATMKDKEDDLLVSCHGVRMMNYLLTVLTVEELQLPVSFCSGNVGENFMKVLITFVEDGRPFSCHRFHSILNKCSCESNTPNKEPTKGEKNDDTMPCRTEIIDNAVREEDHTSSLTSINSDASQANTHNTNVIDNKTNKTNLYTVSNNNGEKKCNDKSYSSNTTSTTATIGDPKRRWNAAHALGTGLGHGIIFLAEPILCNEAIHCLMRIVVKDNIYKVRIQAALALSQIPYSVGNHFFLNRNHGNSSITHDSINVTSSTLSSAQIRFSWGSVASEVAEALCVALQNATTSENFLQYREIEPLKQSLRNALEVMITTATPSAELERVFTTHRNLLRKEGLL